MEFLRKHGALLVKLTVSILILYFVFRQIDTARLGTVLAGAQGTGLIVGLLLLLPSYILGAWRWQLLLRAPGIFLPFGQAFQLTMVGQFFNAFLLGVTGGDVVKIFYATRAAPEKKAAAGFSVAVDRIVGLTALLIVGMGCLAVNYTVLTQTDLARHAVWATLMAALASVLLGGLALTARWWVDRPGMLDWAGRLPGGTIWRGLCEAAATYSRNSATLATTLVLSFPIHAIWLSANYLMARSLGIEIGYWDFISTLPVVVFLMALPVSLSGLGVREGLLVMFLGFFNVAKESALAMALVWWAATLVYSLVGGAIYLRFQSKKRAPQS